MTKKGLLTKEASVIGSSSKGEKRKLTGLTTTEEIKPIEVKAVVKGNKAPLKAELITKLKALEKEYEALDKENKSLKEEKVKNIQTIERLEKKITDMEEQAKKKDIEDVANNAEDLDLSFGPRFCQMCDHEAEDGYQLDAHSWSEHEDEDLSTYQFHCGQCDKKFKMLKDLMTHKKKKHTENISICWNFLNGVCPFGDLCWFKHEINSSENKTESNIKSTKCNICDKTLRDKKDFMMHRKKEHDEKLEMCKLFQKGNCSYKENCWFSHKN